MYPVWRLHPFLPVRCNRFQDLHGRCDPPDQRRQKGRSVLAPATEGQFGPDITFASWKTALKKIGFADMIEVGLGGDMTAAAEAEEWAEAYKEGKKMTTSCCPAFVNMINSISRS